MHEGKAPIDCCLPPSLPGQTPAASPPGGAVFRGAPESSGGGAGGAGGGAAPSVRRGGWPPCYGGAGPGTGARLGWSCALQGGLCARHRRSTPPLPAALAAPGPGGLHCHTKGHSSQQLA